MLSLINIIALTLAVTAAPAPVPDAYLFDELISGVAGSVEKLTNINTEKNRIGKPDIFEKNPELFELHEKLVKIESISNDEDSVSAFLQNYLKKLGLKVKTDESNRNIYAYSGDSENSTILLTSHIDTVPPFIDYHFEDDNDDVKIFGRGSCDAKGSVAAQVIAAKELVEENLVKPEDISMLFVFEEEVGGGGMRTANSWVNDNYITWDTVIFGEPTENKLATGHKGIYLAELEVFGLASHSGYPDVGIDANKILIEIMYDLENYDWPTSEILNKTTVNIGLFSGGTAGNVVSPYAQCEILMRTVTDSDQIIPIVRQIVEKHGSLAESFRLDVQVTDDPVTLDFEVEGFETYIASYATDIPKLEHKNFKRYLYGPGSILVAHGDNEHVSAKSLLKAVEDYKTLVKRSLGI
ncbi:hypothetical protein CANINC_003476 [Pichia inconspicua]|uniref:Peptidase M20 dimerisation domain-containing protein n=1 Tax=Pichia inconspicua TaxID=52247 RepID=A0A4T0WZ06_9ASCO|nr:hypothetical protein CANINC_003476 [[Candida] inconspicua]